jgi:hypothetical protein
MLAESLKMVRQSDIVQDQLSIQNEMAQSIKISKANEQKYPKQENYTRKESFNN